MYDREAILAAVDLPALADELLGPGRGSKRSPSWRCPSPEHPQTGRTPPVTVFVGRAGESRWHCHGCGNGGTAIDLLMQVRDQSARDALADLAVRTGITEQPGVHPVLREPQHPGDRPRSAGPVYIAPQPVAALEHYVTQCAERLFAPEGRPVLQWMIESRGIPEAVLRVNRVGADLGPAVQERPDGVPRVHTAVVLPVLVRGSACYAQLRVLGAAPTFPRYLSVADKLAPNPRLGLYRPVGQRDAPKKRPELIVTEGIIDALSAAAAGYDAAAVLGAEHAGIVAAIALARLPRPLVLALDPDPAGSAATKRMVELLTARHRPPHVLHLTSGDLNENLVRSGDWPVEMAARVDHAMSFRSGPQLGRGTG